MAVEEKARPRRKAKGKATRAAAPEGRPSTQAVGAAVRYDAKNGMATLELREPAKNAGTQNVEMPSERLVLISHYLRARGAFASDVEMAQTLGIDRTRIISWKKGASRPRQEHVRYLADVATTVDTLRRFLHPSVVGDWLTTTQFGLGGRTPVEMLREGRLADVLQAANATEHGAYT